jgi:hypothetical protein
VVILARPDAVRELYAHGPDELDSGSANASLRPLLGIDNVLPLDGAEHLRRRKVVLPPFHGERMRAYEDLMREATRREIATWPADAPVRTLPRMQAIRLSVGIATEGQVLEAGPDGAGTTSVDFSHDSLGDACWVGERGVPARCVRQSASSAPGAGSDRP